VSIIIVNCINNESHNGLFRCRSIKSNIKLTLQMEPILRKFIQKGIQIRIDLGQMDYIGELRQVFKTRLGSIHH